MSIFNRYSFSNLLRLRTRLVFLLWHSKGTFRRDKALLTLLGLGVFIPLFYGTLKIFECKLISAPITKNRA